MKGKLVSQPKLGFGNRLCEGKKLTPLTSIVLDGNHLGHLHEWVFSSKSLLAKREMVGFLLFCLPWIGALVSTYRSLLNEESEVSSTE